MKDRFNLRYVYKNKIYDVYAVDFCEGEAQLVSLDGSEMLFTKIETDKLFQCTGLKDKNGKLIYEGDILEICEPFKRTLYRVKGEIVYETVKGFIYQGSYTTNGHIVRFVKRRLIDLYDDEMNCFDGFICGNIYENPELLEE